MSIKSDKWIRRMAQQHGMIEPFEPGQVRVGTDGQRIVSYGTSSYGYDIRCAPEFKVFTNVYSTVVDPKNFDERSFVDIQADVCVIPPNSFALARPIVDLCQAIEAGILHSMIFWGPPVSARVPMRAAASSSTSRRSNPNGRAM